jgi:hypothetical protein
MIKSSIFELNPNNMRHPFLFAICFLLWSTTTVFAQYTETLNSNRPGGSQGAFSVGTNVLQFETGFSLGKEEHRLLSTQTDGNAIDYSVRYGFFKEELEVSIMGEFQSNTELDTRGAIATERKFSNFKNNTVGVKYMFYDPNRKRELAGPNLYSWKANNRTQWADLIPAISLYAGANFDFADNPFTPELESSISPKIVLSTQNNFIGGFVFVTNIIADRVTTDFPSYGYILTLTHTPTAWFSVFVENQGMKSDFYADQIFRGGAAVLVTPNFQIDGSVLLNFKDTPKRTYGRLGISYRFDMHDKDVFLENTGSQGRANRKKEKAKKKANKNNKRKDGFENDGGLMK